MTHPEARLISACFRLDRASGDITKKCYDVAVKKNKYLVGIRIEGALQAYEETVFEFRDSKIRLEFGNQSQGHFKAYVSVEAERAVVAMNRTNELIAEFLDMMSFATSCSLAALEFFLILKAEPGSVERMVLRQISENKTDDIYIRTDVEVAAITQMLNAAESNADYGLSLRWLRFGYRARTFVEQYTYYWLAFERLLGETQIERECPHCQKMLPSYPSVDWKKAQEIFSTYDSSVDKKYFTEKILKARHRIFHGAKLDAEFYGLLAEISPKVQNVVEMLLSEKHKPTSRIGLDRPNQPSRPNNNIGFYKFTTKSSSDDFAMDYPTDEWLSDFLLSNEATDTATGIELLSFEEYSEKW
ncbi:MAG: hypothetical protein JWN50_731 [Parcubacteria group bacterium]|nr:hypothetical protein [Parcubacteria group bacterium]